MNRQSNVKRGACLSAILCVAVLASACGGGGSSNGGGVIPDDPTPLFVADDPTPAADTISMQAGEASGALFDVEIHVTDIADFFGAAFHVTFDPATVDFLDYDTDGSILTGLNPLFFVDELSGSPGEIAVEAGLQGSGAGLVNGDGLLLTLHFEIIGVYTENDFLFEPISARLVKECPTAGLECPEIQDLVTWSEGTLIVD